MRASTINEALRDDLENPRVVSDPRAEKQPAFADLIASLAPEPAADTWASLGDVANRVVGKLARRTSREIP